MEKKLPACPVETTLMLISDRWKVLYYPGSAGWHKAFRGTEKVRGQYIAESIDRKFALHGGEWAAHPESLSRSTAAGGIYAYGNGAQPKARPGCPVFVGSGI